MHPTSYFVSDLHLFCSRFAGDQEWNRLLELSKRATTVVLGGDIFDFRWTRHSTIERSADVAIQMLASLVRENAQCQFHYVLGNHDHHQSFVERLEHLSCDESNLSHHPYYLRLGGSFFLHGDAATRPKHWGRLENKRRRWLQARRQGRLANLAYDATVGTGLLHLAYLAYRLAYPPQAVARLILAYVSQIGQGLDAGLTDVYFGHTHLALSDFEYEGIRFHNGGAPIRGFQFRILEHVVADG